MEDVDLEEKPKDQIKEIVGFTHRSNIQSFLRCGMDGIPICVSKDQYIKAHSPSDNDIVRVRVLIDE